MPNQAERDPGFHTGYSAYAATNATDNIMSLRESSSNVLPYKEDRADDATVIVVGSHRNHNPRSSVTSFLNRQQEDIATADMIVSSDLNNIKHQRNNMQQASSTWNDCQTVNNNQSRRILQSYGLDEISTTPGPTIYNNNGLMSDEVSHLRKQKPVHGVKLDAIDHEVSKQKINNLMLIQSESQQIKTPNGQKRFELGAAAYEASPDKSHFPKSKLNFTAADGFKTQGLVDERVQNRDMKSVFMPA